MPTYEQLLSALRDIAAVTTNENSDPDAMGEALAEIQGICAGVLKTVKSNKE